MDYNFVADCEELHFHRAVRDLGWREVTRYVKAVIGGCVEKGTYVLRYLFQLRNAQGQTPLHVAVEYQTSLDLVRLIPGGESGRENAECLNMRDSRGYTALHLASAQFDRTYYLDVLLEDGRADVDPIGTGFPETALHLAVIHNQLGAVQLLLLKDQRTDVNAHFYRRIFFDNCLYVSRHLYMLHKWTPLQLAAMAGFPEVVRVLLMCPKVRICSHINPLHDQGHIQF